MQPDPYRDRAVLMCAERRADELLTVLHAASIGEHGWRGEAKRLLREINDLQYPEPLAPAPRRLVPAS